MLPRHPANELSTTQRAGGIASPDEPSATSAGPTDSWAAVECPVDVATQQGQRDRPSRFEIRRALGSGGFGTVDLAWDRLLEREVAIKRPRAKLNAFAEQNFLHEARSAARIRHPGIVVVHDVGVDEAGPFIVYEHVEGGSLKGRLDGKPWPAVDALRLALAIAEALTEAHKQGLTHRDLKPANILLNHAGRPQITDFGLALHADQQESHRGEVAGTYKYMAPEQIRGQAERVDGRTDLWALGAMLYELLTGRSPFSGSDGDLHEQILSRDPRPPRQWVESIPPAVETLVLRLLSKDQLGRPASAAQVADELRQQLQTADDGGIPIRQERPAPQRPLWAVSIAAISMVAMISLVVMVWLIGKGPERRALPPAPNGAGASYPPGVWTPLLDREPLPIVSSEFAPEFASGRLIVKSGYSALFELGNAPASDYSLRVSLLPERWDGDAGIFLNFGSSIARQGEDECLLIGVEQREEEQVSAQFRVRRQMGSGQQAPTYLLQFPGSQDQIPKPPQQEAVILQIDIHNGQLSAVYLNGNQIELSRELDSARLRGEGKFGIYLLRGSCTFSSAAIRVSP